MLERKNTVGVITKQAPPDKYALVMLNDDVTPLDKVIKVLTEVFEYQMQAAVSLARKAEGSGAVVIKTHLTKDECRKYIKSALKIAPTLGIMMKKEKSKNGNL